MRGVGVLFPSPEVHGESFEVDRVASGDGVCFCQKGGGGEAMGYGVEEVLWRRNAVYNRGGAES